MSETEFLNAEELLEVTGYKTASMQCDWLDSKGWQYAVLDGGNRGGYGGRRAPLRRQLGCPAAYNSIDLFCSYRNLAKQFEPGASLMSQHLMAGSVSADVIRTLQRPESI